MQCMGYQEKTRQIQTNLEPARQQSTGDRPSQTGHFIVISKILGVMTRSMRIASSWELTTAVLHFIYLPFLVSGM